VSKRDIFGLEFDLGSLEDAVAWVMEHSALPASYVVTPNLDHFRRWEGDPHFRSLYRHAGLTVLDGTPLVWLARRQGARATRITGVDLVEKAFAAASRSSVPIAIVGGEPGTAESAASNLLATYPGLSVVFTGSPTADDLRDPGYLALLADAFSDYPELIVALCVGSPKQEQLAFDLQELGATGAYLCVGAAVDFFAGRFNRAPRIVQRLGFEWVYRMAQEPRRLFKRYFVGGLFFLPYAARTVFRARSE